MKKKLVTLFSVLTIIPCTFFATTSCTFEDIFDHVAEEQKKLDRDKGKNDSDEKNQKENYDFIITPQNVTGDFRKFFQSIADKHSNILIKDGTYDIELVNDDGVKPKDGSTITFEKNAKIRVKPNNLSFYCVIDLRGRKNITIKNPNLEGDKYTHLGTTGQWGHGINIVDCSNITIHNAYATKFWGDGIYMRDCENIRIHNAHLPDNRRQGVSITAGHDIEIHNLVAENTGGQDPGYGIDIEPNWNRNNITKLRIYKPILRNNGKGKSSYTTGISFSPHRAHIKEPKHSELVDTHYDIEIFDPVFEGDALMISAPTNYVKGSIKIHNPTFYRSKKSAIYINNHQSDFFKTEIINPKFIDCVEAPANRHSVYLAPITITCFKHLSHRDIGNKNITITNPVFEASSKAKYKIAAIRNSTTNFFKDDLRNVVIENVLSKGYEVPFFNYTGSPSTNSAPHPSFSLTFSEKSELPSLPLTYGNSVSKTFDGGAINYALNSDKSTIYIENNVPISNFEFYYANNSKDKSPLRILFGTKKQPTKVYIGKLYNKGRLSGIEIPYGGYIKMTKSYIDNEGIQHWTVTKVSDNVRGIN